MAVGYMLRRIAIASAFLFGMSVGLFAQLRIIPREKIDSVANPPLSADSAALRFETRHIVAKTMNEDDDPETFVFRFRNVGTDVIRIDRLVSTCSCASATIDRNDVAPGENAEIRVRYNPEGHPGRFERKVFVYAGGRKDPAAVLRLTVNVENGADLSRLWPVQMGKIRLRRSEVEFEEGRKAVESLRFVNLAGKPLRLQCEEMFLPECLKFRVSPEVVEDGGEGVMYISYDPSCHCVKKQMKVILKGLGTAPSSSSITVRIKPETENR